MLKNPEEEKEIRIRITKNDFIDYGNKILEDFKKFSDNNKGIELVKPNFEGVKIRFDKRKCDGWLLLRMSLHEPLLVVNCESNVKGGTEKMLLVLKEFLSEYSYLDLQF